MLHELKDLADLDIWMIWMYIASLGKCGQRNEILMVVDGTSCQLRKVGSVEGLVPLSRSTTWLHQGSCGIFWGISRNMLLLWPPLLYIYIYMIDLSYMYVYIYVQHLFFIK